MSSAPPPTAMMIEFSELAASIADVRRRFERACDETRSSGGTADAAAGAIAMHLGATKADELPLAAKTIWRDRILRPLKADAAKPLPARAIAAIRSWPSSRVDELLRTLAEIEAILDRAENDARNEVIYAEISRAYS